MNEFLNMSRDEQEEHLKRCLGKFTKSVDDVSNSLSAMFRTYELVEHEPQTDNNSLLRESPLDMSMQALSRLQGLVLIANSNYAKFCELIDEGE